MSLANNDGDPRKAAKSFASKQTYQSVGMSMLAAGLTHGMLEHFGLATDVTKVVEFADHAANQGVTMASRMATDTDTIFTGRTDGKAALLGSIAGTIGGYLSTKIGTWYKGSEATAVDAISHKILHAIKGGTEGLIISLGDGGLDAEGLGKVVAGAAGGFISEVVADTLMPTGGIDRMAPGDRPDYSDNQIRQTQAIARMVTGAIAYAAGMSADEMGVAMFSATTSLDHNFAPSARSAGAMAEEEQKGDDAEIAEEPAPALSIGGREFSPDDGALTPRRYSAREAELKAIENNKLLSEMIAGNQFNPFFKASDHPYVDVKQAGLTAYNKTQSELGSSACSKKQSGLELTDYERTVRRDDRMEHQRYWRQMGGYAAGLGVGMAALATAPVSMPLAVGLALTGGAIDGAASLNYTVNSRTDVAIVAGSSIFGGAMLFVPGVKMEVLAAHGHWFRKLRTRVLGKLCSRPREKR